MQSKVFGVLVAFLALGRGKYWGMGVTAKENNQQYGGKDIATNKYRWFTSIRRFDDERLLCSGFLVGSRYVVTARHCVADGIENIFVEVGYLCTRRSNCFRPHEFIGVKDFSFHDKGGDMALLELDRAVSLPIQPAVPYLGDTHHPSQKAVKNGRKMKMIGAGRAGTTDGITDRVTQLSVKFLPRDKCEKEVNNKSLLTDYTICSSAKEGSPCEGDSGSALIVEGKGRKLKGRDVVLAVHRFGPTDCSNAKEDQLLGHFRMEDAAELFLSKICDGSTPEDWCPSYEDMASRIPTSAVNDSVPSSKPTPNHPTPRTSSKPSFRPSQDPGARQTPYPMEAPPSPLFPSSPYPSFRPSPQPPNPTSHPSPNPTSRPSPNPTNIRIKLQASLQRTLTDTGANDVRVAFNSDGSRVASFPCEGGEGKIWDTSTTAGGPISKLRRVRCGMEWSPSRNVIAALDSSSVRIYNLVDADGSVASEIELFASSISASKLTWHPDGITLAVGFSDGSVRIFDTANYSLSNTFWATDSSKYSIYGLSFDPHGALLATAAPETESGVKLWDVGNSYNHLRTLGGGYFLNGDKGLLFSPDGHFLAAPSGLSVTVWEVGSGVLKHDLVTETATMFYGIAWSPDGRFLMGGSFDDTAVIWDALNGGSALLTLTGHRNSIWSVDWSPDGIHLASGSRDGTAKIWRITEQP